MRSLLTILLTLSYAILPAQTRKIVTDPFINSQKKISITGHLKNYKPGNDNRFISFRSYSISGRVNDSAAFIKEDGQFEISLSQAFEGDIAFYFLNKFVTLYGVPGEKIELEIDFEKLLSDEDKSKAITVTGVSAPISKLILQYKQPRLDSIPNDENWNDTTLTDQSIAKARIKRMNSDLDSLTQWIKKNGIINKKFENWARNNIIYEAGFEIGFSLYTAGRRSANDKQLFDMLKEIPLENETALNNSNYYHYLSIMSGGLQIIVNINPMYDSVRRQLGNNSVPIYLKKMDQYSKGFTRQMMYYNTLIYNSVERTSVYQENFDSVIKNNYLKDQGIVKTSAQPFQEFNIVQRLKEYKADDSIKTRLISFFESNKKTLFVDFWGDWCIPCMHEMPHFSELVRQFKDSEIGFLFLGVETTEEKSNQVKRKFNIDAPFFVLSNNEIRILNNILRFSSYPTHFIIGPSGVVKENFSMKVNSGNELNKFAIDRLKKYSALWY